VNSDISVYDIFEHRSGGTDVPTWRRELPMQLVVCKLCGAVVHYLYEYEHRDFHRNL
jgi:hypothetical protein